MGCLNTMQCNALPHTHGQATCQKTHFGKLLKVPSPNITLSFGGFCFRTIRCSVHLNMTERGKRRVIPLRNPKKSFASKYGGRGWSASPLFSHRKVPRYNRVNGQNEWCRKRSKEAVGCHVMAPLSVSAVPAKCKTFINLVNDATGTVSDCSNVWYETNEEDGGNGEVGRNRNVHISGDLKFCHSCRWLGYGKNQ